MNRLNTLFVSSGFLGSNKLVLNLDSAAEDGVDEVMKQYLANIAGLNMLSPPILFGINTLGTPDATFESDMRALLMPTKLGKYLNERSLLLGFGQLLSAIDAEVTAALAEMVADLTDALRDILSKAPSAIDPSIRPGVCMGDLTCVDKAFSIFRKAMVEYATDKYSISLYDWEAIGFPHMASRPKLIDYFYKVIDGKTFFGEIGDAKYKFGDDFYTEDRAQMERIFDTELEAHLVRDVDLPSTAPRGSSTTSLKRSLWLFR